MYSKIIFSSKLVVILNLSLAFIFAAEAKVGQKISQSPEAFLIQQTNRAIAKAKSIPPRVNRGQNQRHDQKNNQSLSLQTSPTKTAWLNTIYEKNIVSTSDYSAYMSDKLLMSSVFERTLGESTARQYLPKTMGLRQFLERHQLVNRQGKLVADGDQIDAALHADFPAGFFVRPAVGITPFETERGMYSSQEQLINELLKGKTPVYDPATYWLPIKSHILGDVASGEAVVLQENLTIAADLKGRLKRKAATLVRVHTYEQKIIPGSVPKRWVQSDADDVLSEASLEGAQKFAQQFLEQLPEELTRRQAWSIEVAAFDNGTYRVANILTNRGKQIAWSSYLDQPRILEAYTDYFEAEGDLLFEGFGGRILRSGFANYFTYWKLRFEKAQGWQKLVAAFPPLL